MLDDHYTILGIHRDPTPEEIHDAYLAVAKTCHPDTNPDDPEAAKKFIRVQAAYDVLSNRISRMKYDRTSISFATARNGKMHARPAATPTAAKKTPQASGGKVIERFYRESDPRLEIKEKLVNRAFALVITVYALVIIAYVLLVIHLFTR